MTSHPAPTRCRPLPPVNHVNATRLTFEGGSALSCAHPWRRALAAFTYTGDSALSRASAEEGELLWGRAQVRVVLQFLGNRRRQRRLLPSSLEPRLWMGHGARLAGKGASQRWPQMRAGGGTARGIHMHRRPRVGGASVRSAGSNAAHLLVLSACCLVLRVAFQCLLQEHLRILVAWEEHRRRLQPVADEGL